MGERELEPILGVAKASRDMSESEAEAPSKSEPTGEIAVLLGQAERLTMVFRRLFWVAMAGVALTLAVVLCGDWEAHPGRCMAWASLGQTWLLGMALWAFRVYGRAEALEQAAQAASARGGSLDGHGRGVTGTTAKLKRPC